MNKTNICLIILNYNSFAETKKLVENLQSWDHNKLSFCIVIVDNCSTDQSFKLLQSSFSSTDYIDVICSEKNGGYSYGNNYGARYAIEKYNPIYLAFANPDIQIDQKTMIELLKGFEVDRDIAMVAPVMKNTLGEYSVYSQKLPSFNDDFRSCWTEKKPPCIQSELFDTIPGHENMIITEMLPGSFFVVKTSCFQSAGMFDEAVFLFCEERIIGKRFKSHGYKLILRKDLYFTHAHSVIIKKALDNLQIWRIIWSSRIYYQREYNKVSWFKHILLQVGVWYFLKRMTITSILYRWKNGKT